MKYMGSKARFANELLPIILKERTEGQWYVEPFCGGCNMIDKVTGYRMACDNNPFLIAMWNGLIYDTFFRPRMLIDKEYYSQMRDKYNKDKRGKFLGPSEMAERGVRNYIKENIENTSAQVVSLRGVLFSCCDYKDIELPSNAIIYCDPPYANTKQYTCGLNHEEFWQKCRDWVKDGHKVFVSEYRAPRDFVCVWEKKTKTALNQEITKDAVERLFVHESQYQKEEHLTLF